jgi:hypothetical protein
MEPACRVLSPLRNRLGQIAAKNSREPDFTRLISKKILSEAFSELSALAPDSDSLRHVGCRPRLDPPQSYGQSEQSAGRCDSDDLPCWRQCTYCPSCYVDCGKRAVTDGAGAYTIAGLDPSLVFELAVIHDGHVAAFVKKVEKILSRVRGNPPSIS